MKLNGTLITTVVLTGFVVLAYPASLLATAPIITYTAAGTFGSTPISGADTLRLASEPFTVSISVSASTVPYTHGSNWAAYHQLKLTGVVHSGLLGPSPVTIVSNEASIIQAIAPGQYDQFTMQAPIKVVGINLTIKAVIIMPLGTIKKTLLYPFPWPVSMVPANATVTYSDGTSATVLPVQTGTFTGTIPSPGKSISAMSWLESPGGVGLLRRRDLI